MQRMLIARSAVWIVAGALTALQMRVGHAESDPAVAPCDGSTSVPECSRSSRSVLPGLDEFVDGLIAAFQGEHRALPGVTVSVVKDLEIVFLKGYGLADVEKNIPVDPARTMFRIGSVSKTFTGLAVMQLVEKGLLDLDADVNVYLKGFSIPATHEGPITLRALLSHRAGFEDSGLGHLFERNPADVLPMRQYLAEFMPRRVREPGVTSTYSNYGSTLAGYIVEAVSGQDFSSYVEEHIFKPLRMNHSSVREPLGAGHPQSIAPQLEPYLAVGYAKGPNGQPVERPFDLIGQVGPAGSLSSTALDMARYMLARLDDDRYPGGRLVKPETAARMRERLYDDRPLSSDMAHMMVDGLVNGYKVRWHNGGTTTFATEMALLPELDLGIFVSMNSMDGGPQASFLIPRLIIERYFPARSAPPAPAPPADFVERGRKYAGRYLPTRRSYSQLEKIVTLGNTSRFEVDDDGYLVQTERGKQTKWVEIKPGVFQAVDNDRLDPGRTNHLYFYEDDNGVPVRIGRLVNDLERITFSQSPAFFFWAVGAAVLFSLSTLLGGFRRLRQTATLETAGAQWATRLAVAAALTVLIAVAGLILTIVTVANDGTSLIFDWPPASLSVSLYATLAVIGLTLGLLALARAVWVDNRVGLWRRLHYSMFTLSLIVLVVAFNEWNLVGFRYH